MGSGERPVCPQVPVHKFRLLFTYDANASEWGVALSDWLGTKRVQVDPEVLANVTSFLSLPFGDGLVSSGYGEDSTEHHFTGQIRDLESGNDYFNARYYSSNVGRFTSPDPGWFLSANLSNPQSWNMYSYALGNPLSNIDPTGMNVCFYGGQGDTPILFGANGSDSDVTDYDDSSPQDCAAQGGTSYRTEQTVTANANYDNTEIPDSNVSTTWIPSVSPTSTAPSKVGCNTVLPNGKTLGQYINQGRAQMQASVNAGGSFNGEALTTFASIARDYGQIDFKNGAGGNSVLANRAQLGQAGNFAYYAIGSGYLSPGLLDAGAGAYAITSALLGKKPFSTLTGPMFSDASAASVRNAGLATPGCPQ
jgi:RHS repeat-associated protein